jgi:hydroxymethylglutaryl-CoA reductase
MSKSHVIKGFSKLSRIEKISWLQQQEQISDETIHTLDSHIHPEEKFQELYADISENYISNFVLPLGLAPNFLVNGNLLTVPMVIEESSVVAAASSAAKFWALHGGFRTRVLNMLKSGQVHFTWNGPEDQLLLQFKQKKQALLQSLKPLTQRMEARGGGIETLEIRKGSSLIPDYYQLFLQVRTGDAMGANFINSILETLAGRLPALVEDMGENGELDVIMSILSNYTPECLVQCELEGDMAIFDSIAQGKTGREFADRFKLAVDIAQEDTFRAVTHNKGIYNGMDAVILATGNDFRAVEACGHAYASKQGHYRSLSNVELSGKTFRFHLEVPLAIGTVGGLTSTHPMASVALEILGNPSAEELMQVIAAAGLANNFSAVRSLITTGIQKGHMKMHLGNILRQLEATPEERILVMEYFQNRSVSHAEVSAFLANLREEKPMS